MTEGGKSGQPGFQSPARLALLNSKSDFYSKNVQKVAAPASRLADKKKFGAIFFGSISSFIQNNLETKNKLANFQFGNFWESSHLQNIQISHKKISLHKLGCSCNNILGFISILF